MRSALKWVFSKTHLKFASSGRSGIFKLGFKSGIYKKYGLTLHELNLVGHKVSYTISYS